MNAKPANPPVPVENDLSRALYLAICAALLLPLWLVGYCVIHTEGEVMHYMFRGMTVLAGVLVMAGFRRRKVAAAWIACLCGALLIWQTWKIRKWAMIHEDVIGLLWHVQEFKRGKGEFPDSIESYSFHRAWVKGHIMDYRKEGEKFRLMYFMNHPGTSYWYDSGSGFGYYPD